MLKDFSNGQKLFLLTGITFAAVLLIYGLSGLWNMYRPAQCRPGEVWEIIYEPNNPLDYEWRDTISITQVQGAFVEYTSGSKFKFNGRFNMFGDKRKRIK